MLNIRRAILGACALALSLSAGALPVAAQWPSPNHAIPIGKGAGVTGFGALGPCAAGGFPVWTGGATLDPTCSTTAGSLATLNGRLTVDATPVYDIASNVLAVTASFGLNTGTVTVSASKTLSVIRIMQPDNTSLTANIGAGGVFTGFDSQIVAGATSNVNSAAYGAILHATNLGAGTVRGIHAQGAAGAGSTGFINAVVGELQPVATTGSAVSFYASLVSAAGVHDLAVGYDIQSTGDRFAVGFGSTIAATPIGLAYYRAWMATASSANARAFQVLNNAGSEIGSWNKDSTITILSATAIPAGGTAGSGYKFTSTSNFGIFPGSGAPTLAAAKGSLYLRSDGAGNRTYVNTDGATTWLALDTPPLSSITGLGTGVATALAVNVGSAGAFVVNGGALGTPSSGTLSSATGLPVSSGISGLGTGVATALAVNVGSPGAFFVDTGTAWISYTPTITCAVGAYTTATATGSYKFIGKTVVLRVKLVVTTLGTCSGATMLTIPIAAVADQAILGVENQANGKMIKLPLNSGSTTTGGITYYDNTNATAAPVTFQLSGVYESQ